MRPKSVNVMARAAGRPAHVSRVLATLLVVMNWLVLPLSYELNINSYGKRFGWDFIYQDAHNFTG